MKKITLLIAFLLTIVTSGYSQTIVIGTGTATTAGTGSDPVDGYFEAMRYQVVYTAAELSASLTPYDQITALGFSVDEDYAGGALLGYTIKMGHTSATNSATHNTSSTSVVKNAFDYDPTVTAAGVFDMIVFDTPFIWNGVDNILVEICTDGPNAYVSPYGGVRTTSMTSGSRRYRTDGATACDVSTNNANTNRPNIQFNYIDGVPPSCLPPSAGTSVVTSSTTATLNWNSGGAANAEVAIQPVGTGVPAIADNTGANATGNSYSAIGLTPATAYEFYVRDECTIGSSFSTWSGPYNFNTTQLPNCATFVSPLDAATNVVVGNGVITLTWAAPASGDAPTSYDLYASLTTPIVAGDFIGNYLTTSTTLNIGSLYNTTIYWKIVPKNIIGSATGCAEWSFTTEVPPGYCLAASYGLYPAATYAPTVCDGLTVGNITTIGYAGEFSNVNVTAGETYKFQSSNTADFITISTDDGDTAAISGVTPVTWVSTVTGVVRFYTHADNQCGEEEVNRTRSVICGVPTCTMPTVTFAKASNCPTETFNVTANITNLGSATSITVTDNQANPSQQVTATGLVTFGPYQSGDSVILTVANDQDNSCTVVSTTQTQTACPPVNDDCAGAITLTPAVDFASGAITATLLGATDSEDANPSIPAPGCASYIGHDVWFTVTVPSSGSITLETGGDATSAVDDTGMAVYTGDCFALVLADCDDFSSSNSGDHALITLDGTTSPAVSANDVLYVRAWRYNSTSVSRAINGVGDFQIAAWDPSLSANSFDLNGFKAYPNPVKDIFKVSYIKNISTVSVTNLVGQEVMSKKVNALQSDVDMSALASGTYLVKVTSEGLTKTIKVIKE